MALLTSITQAARNALAAWLVTELEDTGVVVEPRWFEVDRGLPPKSISIIDAGPRKIEWTDPEQLSVTDAATGFVSVVWGLGYIEQRVQIDVWAQSDVELDDLIARLDVALNPGPRALGIASNVDPVGVGLQLTMADGWEPGIADYTFDEPSSDQTADAANQSEWHAMYRGTVMARLTQTATSPKLARIHLNQRLGTAAPDPTAATDLTTTIDATTPVDA